MIDLALPDHEGRLVRLTDAIAGSAATALLSFRGFW
jgi:hypothetical protein